MIRPEGQSHLTGTVPVSKQPVEQQEPGGNSPKRKATSRPRKKTTKNKSNSFDFGINNSRKQL